MVRVWECILYTLTRTMAIMAMAIITSSRVNPEAVCRTLDTGYWILDTGWSMLDARCLMFRVVCRMLEIDCRILCFDFCFLDPVL
jgi:hypothetical protein